MKRWLGVLMLLTWLAFAATPAFADNGRDDRFCVGGSTIVRGNETPRSVVLFGCGARILSGARITQDVVSFGGDVVLEPETSVGNDLVVFGSSAQIAGRIEHEVFVMGGRVTLEPTAVVGNDVVIFGGVVDRKEGAIVRGSILHETGGYSSRAWEPASPRVPPVPVAPRFYGDFWGGLFSGFVQSFLTALGLAALGALILVFLPAQTKQVSEVATQSALSSLGVGCLTWLVVPPLIVLFIITCLGIPLSMILGVLLAAAAVFGWIALSVVLGDRVLNALKAKTTTPIIAMLVGLLILWLVTAIPILGWFVGLFLLALAVGAVVLTRFGTQPYPLPPAPVAVAPTTAVVPVEPNPPVAADASATPGGSVISDQ